VPPALSAEVARLKSFLRATFRLDIESSLGVDPDDDEPLVVEM